MNIILRLAWRNLWRYPRRTWLTTGAMIFSNVLLIFMISLQVGMYGLMIDNTLQAFTGHIQIQAPGYKDDMKMRQVVPDVINLASHVREGLATDKVAARGAAFALVSSEERSFGIQVYGVQPKFEPLVSNLPGLTKEGRYLESNDAAEIVIGKALARNLQVNIGDELTLLGSGRDGSFSAGVVIIVGIFESGISELDRSIAEVPLLYFQDTFFMEGAGHQVVINALDYTLTDVLMPQVKNLLPADTDLIAHDWNALQPGLRQAIQTDIGSAVFMYAILIVLVAFSVLNTLLMSVLERTREFGIVMSLGLTPGRLGRLVMLESAMMGAIGLFGGALLGGLVTFWFVKNGLTYSGMEELTANFNLPGRMYPHITPFSLLIGPSVVFLFTLFAAIYPAVRLYWLHPVEAMRSA